MKCATTFLLFALMLVAVSALPRRSSPRLPPPSGNPHFGGYGSFNPHRGRRSPGEGKVVVDRPINGKATVDGHYSEKVYDGKYGSVHVYGSGKASENEKAHATAGIHAEITFGGDDAGNADDAAALSGAINARLREIERYRKEMKLDR